jgi:hypothetical protein
MPKKATNDNNRVAIVIEKPSLAGKQYQYLNHNQCYLKHRQ